MKKLLQLVMLIAIIGSLSTSIEVRPMIGDLVEGVVGTAANVASDVAGTASDIAWGPYWWDNYWGPDYWNDAYYPYLIERYPYVERVELTGDNWDITNKTNKEIIVGTYDGKIHGRIRPGETIRIPTQGDNRLIIGHQNAKAKVTTAKPGPVIVTEKNAQEIQINP